MQNIASLQKSKSFWGWVALVSGIGVSWLLLNALIGVVTGLINPFSTLRAYGTADPSELAGDISIALLTGFWGAIFSIIFLIPFVIAVIKYRKFRLLLSITNYSQNQESEQGGDGDAEEAV